MDAAVAAVLSELDAIFRLKEDQRAARKACLDGKAQEGQTAKYPPSFFFFYTLYNANKICNFKFMNLNADP